ncbi:septum-promoting GTP-binding protein 1 [Gigaspora margarita]|uniref:Septum-promoting GTP-binding protein 1 n=1 Tax=Gigaspora margarita TaxID=4874 RepID=A0A8H4EQN6_GIGMA|nr:septum-promoting GTP-binding protein 1 [Gigaspora margarita]
MSMAVIKVGMIGDSETGKTSLMRKFTESEFDLYYCQTNGLHFNKKTISLQNTKIRFNIWDGHSDFISYVCNDSVAILFMFDLSRKSILISIKSWYKQTKRLNKHMLYFLIGTKYDIFTEFENRTQQDIIKMTCNYTNIMNASLIFCSSKQFINVNSIFKVILSQQFKIICKLPEVKEVGCPILEYKTNQETKEICQKSYQMSKVLSLNIFRFDFWTYTKSILYRLKII